MLAPSAPLRRDGARRRDSSSRGRARLVTPLRMKKWKSMASILAWLHFLLIFSTHAKAVAQGEDHRTRLAVWRDLEWKCCHPPVFPPVFELQIAENWHDAVYGRVVEASTTLSSDMFPIHSTLHISIQYLVRCWLNPQEKEIMFLLYVARYDADWLKNLKPCARERRQHLT